MYIQNTKILCTFQCLPLGHYLLNTELPCVLCIFIFNPLLTVFSFFFLVCLIFVVLPNIATPITDQDALIKHVTSGNLKFLPEPSKTTVRVFLASNYDGEFS